MARHLGHIASLVDRASLVVLTITLSVFGMIIRTPNIKFGPSTSTLAGQRCNDAGARRSDQGRCHKVGLLSRTLPHLPTAAFRLILRFLVSPLYICVCILPSIYLSFLQASFLRAAFKTLMRTQDHIKYQSKIKEACFASVACGN